MAEDGRQGHTGIRVPMKIQVPFRYVKHRDGEHAHLECSSGWNVSNHVGWQGVKPSFLKITVKDIVTYWLDAQRIDPCSERNGFDQPSSSVLVTTRDWSGESHQERNNTPRGKTTDPSGFMISIYGRNVWCSKYRNVLLKTYNAS